jgi:hypothetical protein
MIHRLHFAAKPKVRVVMVIVVPHATDSKMSAIGHMDESIYNETIRRLGWQTCNLNLRVLYLPMKGTLWASETQHLVDDKGKRIQPQPERQLILCLQLICFIYVKYLIQYL